MRPAATGNGMTGGGRTMALATAVLMAGCANAGPETAAGTETSDDVETKRSSLLECHDPAGAPTPCEGPGGIRHNGARTQPPNIRAADRAAAGVPQNFFATPGFLFEPETPYASLKTVPIWNEIEQMLDNPYAMALVPVGLAWQRFLRSHEQPVLHDKDQSHPTLAGTYLAACVFLAALFGENPVGIDVDVPSLSGEDRTALQAAAWQAWESPAGQTRITP